MDPLLSLIVMPASTPSLTALKVVGAIVWFAVMARMMAATTDDLQRIAAQAVIACLQKAQLTRKEAASVMGIEEAQLNRQLRGEPMQHLSVARLLRLASRSEGVVFWAHFAPTLMYLVAERRFAEIADDFRTKA